MAQMDPSSSKKCNSRERLAAHLDGLCASFDINNCFLAPSVPKKVLFSLVSSTGRRSHVFHPDAAAERSFCRIQQQRLPQQASRSHLRYRHTYSNTCLIFTPAPLTLHKSEGNSVDTGNKSDSLWWGLWSDLCKTCRPHSPLWWDQSCFSDRVSDGTLEEDEEEEDNDLCFVCMSRSSPLFGLNKSGFRRRTSLWWLCPTVCAQNHWSGTPPARRLPVSVHWLYAIFLFCSFPVLKSCQQMRFPQRTVVGQPKWGRALQSAIFDEFTLILKRLVFGWEVFFFSYMF